MRGGEVSSRELVELYLERIARLDPELNSFRVVMAERALAEADQADARRAGGEERPLLGVPVAVKDNVDVARRGHRGRQPGPRPCPPRRTPRSSAGCGRPALW